MRGVTLIVLILVAAAADAYIVQINLKDDTQTNDDPESQGNVLSDCNQQWCDILCHMRGRIDGNACVNGICKCDNNKTDVVKGMIAARPVAESFIHQLKVSCSDAWCQVQCFFSGYPHGECYGENYCRCWK